MTDILIDWMKSHDVPVTRNAYLALAYPEGEPDDWSAELEATLPPELQWDLTGPMPKQLSGFSIAEWAQYFSHMDRQRIDTAIRGGMIGGLDNTEIARRVIGSLELLGIDGVTEITRQHIARLGRVAISPRKK